MKHLPEILTFLLWPVLLAISYYASVYAIRRFEKKHGTEEK